MSLSQDEFSRYQDGWLARDYWRSKSEGAEGKSEVTGRRLIPKIYVGPTLDRIFGGSYIDFQTNGFVSLDFGAQYQKVANPNLPVRQQRYFLPLDFDQQMSINFTGKVGEKMKLTGNFDSKASFQFEQNLKLDYTGFEEDIIQKIEAGNVSMPLNSTLITGAQNLFGLKTQLRFGRLNVTTIMANQRARLDEVNMQGGVQKRRFEVKASDYEDNRHFLLGQFFRKKYEPSLQNISVFGSGTASSSTPAANRNRTTDGDQQVGDNAFPTGDNSLSGSGSGSASTNRGISSGAASGVNSGVNITRMEVYVTNRNNNTETLRNLVAFLDLGEKEPFNKNAIQSGTVSRDVIDNNVNNLYSRVANNAGVRNADQTSEALTALGLSKGTDFEILRGARKLSDREFTFQPQLGYISLNTPLRNDEILGVAFEYTLNGRKYQVGELTEDYQTRDEKEVIILKLLRPSAVRLDLPTWDLMMKNVYSLGSGQINREGFQFRVIYKDDLTGIDNPSLQEGNETKDVPLVQVFNLDRLNPQGDPQPDGNFDWIEGVTIDSQNGRIIFPVLEPFGSYLTSPSPAVKGEKAAGVPWINPQTEQTLANKYVFDILYRRTKADAQQQAEKNKFFLKGYYQSSASSSVQLPAFGTDPSSVVVTAGGVPLTPGTDYIVENGEVKIINEGILQSGREISIQYEQPDLFNNQMRTLMGTRLDYTLSKDFTIGSTLMRLRERPIIRRVAMGNEPTNNTIFGLDANLKKDSRFLTRMIDKLPLIQTKELSGLTFTGEYAKLFPGVAPLAQSNSFIDDFEGTETPFDLTRQPQVRWKLGATPQLFPEGNPNNNKLDYTYRRAKLAWYSIDNTVYFNNSIANISEEAKRNHYVRRIDQQEIYPRRAEQPIDIPEATFDLAYYPAERGMYNYNPAVDVADGKVVFRNRTNPEELKKNWAAITRAITYDIDFDNSNVQYIEFWMMDPFIRPNTSGNDKNVLVDGQRAYTNPGGLLYFNLGNVSEDVMNDNRHAFENGLPATDNATTNQPEPTTWGAVPSTQYLTNAFENTKGSRARQDVGLDGLTNEAEKQRAEFNPPGLDITDPSGDDFTYFLDPRFNGDTPILERYKNFNGMEGNSPEVGNQNIATSSTYLPDNEDLNTDNTVSDLESYYQYKVELKPNELATNQYVVDSRKPPSALTGGDDVTWYQFRIPVREFTEKVGDIDNFKSIRFIRMFMTGWSQPVVLRMSQLQLVANQWRAFEGSLNEKGLQLPVEPYDARFTVGTVNIEENSVPEGDGSPYILPPGFQRDRDITTLNNRELNEQSLRLCVDGLRDKDARAVFKNVNLNFLLYKRLKMFLHAETDRNSNTRDEDVSAFVRVGTDFTENYYEIEKFLIMTPSGSTSEDAIWPRQNEIDIPFDELVRVKTERNKAGGSVLVPFTLPIEIDQGDGQRIGYRITVVGNPDLSSTQIMMIGIRNPFDPAGDTEPKSVCIWADELRASEFDQTAGWAATGRLNLKLADFATITASARHTTYGFGGLQDKISQRATENTTQWDAAANINLDKLLPQRFGVKIPMFIGYERERIQPHFNPLDPDVPLTESINSRFANRSEDEKQNYRKIVEANSTRRSINFTNIQKTRVNAAKQHLWDIENFSVSYAYSDLVRTDILTEQFLQKNYRGGIGYSYNNQPKYIEPFKKLKFLNSPWFKWLQEFNFNLAPNSIALRGDLDRTFAKTQLRNSDLTTRGIAPYYEKFFTFNRLYDLRWNLSKNLSLDYTATANAVIDEPYGDIDDSEIDPITGEPTLGTGYTKKDSLMANLKRLGRMKNFQQQTSATYRLPLDKFPLTDWLKADVRYSAGYQWLAASLGAVDTAGNFFGNLAQNNRDRTVNGQIDLTRLYNKVKFLKAINEPPKKQPATGPRQQPNTPQNPNVAVKDTVKPKPEFKVLKGVVRALMTARNITFNYSLQESTILPGMLSSPKFFGVDSSFRYPGTAFTLLGSQDPSVKKTMSDAGLWSKSYQLNNPFMQTQTENFTARTDLEPFRDFKIRLDVRRTRSSDYTELYRMVTDTLDNGEIFDGYLGQSPNLAGDYTISFISVKTAFSRIDQDTKASEVFRKFEENRDVAWNRLNAINGELGRYDTNSQDVLIPAFIAAYSGKDVNKMNLSPFPKIPLPNWRVDYAGLSRVEALKKYFSSVNLQHSYTSNYSVRNFISAAEYSEPGTEGVLKLNNAINYPYASIPNDTGIYVPVYVIDQVVISERFAPLIGIDVRTTNRITARIQYNTERIVALGLNNRQVQELNSKDITLSLGFTRNNVRLPFRTQGRNVVLKNDLTFRCDMSVRDTKTIQRKIEGENTITQGNLNCQFKPTVNYLVNERLTVQGYFERSVNNKPWFLFSYPRTVMRVGFNLRYSLSQ